MRCHNRPQITDDFRVLSDASWYGAAYLLTSTALQPTWGKIYQVFGAKNVFVLVVVIFLVGSLTSGAAMNSKIFIVGRAIAGIGAGGMFAGAFTIMVYILPLHRRPAFLGGLTGSFFVLTTGSVC